MSKELTPLEWLNYYKNKLQNSSQTFRPNGFDIIETALKEKEQQDALIRVLKEVFEFGIINEKVIEKDDGSLSLLGQIEYTLRREISKKEKMLYRDFILKKCFPKELKVLEIIKECFDLNGFDELVPNSKWFESEEKQDLLKEVLLWKTKLKRNAKNTSTLLELHLVKTVIFNMATIIT